MRIRGIEQFSAAERLRQEEAGGRYVFFEYSISLIFLTLRKPSAVYFLRPDQSRILRGLPYTVLSLFLGWWGVPWGVVYTPLVILTNLSGGRDVTAQVQSWLRQEAPGERGNP